MGLGINGNVRYRWRLIMRVVGETELKGSMGTLPQAGVWPSDWNTPPHGGIEIELYSYFTLEA